MVNNHTDVWGSWYDSGTGTWGYACCHSIIHVSYCSGRAGIDAAQASSAQALLAVSAGREEEEEEEEDPRSAPRKIEQNFSKQRVGEGEVSLNKSRLEEALKQEKKRKKGGYEDERSGKKSKTDITSSSHDVTEEELGTHLVLIRVLLLMEFLQRRIRCHDAWRTILWQTTSILKNYVLYVFLFVRVYKRH